MDEIIATYLIRVTVREHPSRAIRNIVPPTNEALEKVVEAALVAGTDYFADEVTARSERVDE